MTLHSSDFGPALIRRIGFLLFPGFPMACLTAAIDTLHTANELAGNQVFSWSLITETGTQATASAGVPFSADCSLAETDAIDCLFLLSGPEAGFDDPASGHGRLRYLARHGVILGAAAGGVFPLARSGVLSGRRCAVHWSFRSAFESAFPDCTAVDRLAVRDGPVHTVSGAAAMFDLTLELIENELGEAAMNEVACMFQHPVPRSVSARQKVPVLQSGRTVDQMPPAVKQAMFIFSENVETPVGIREVARMAGISPRQLERSFRTATGLSPGEYYRRQRLKTARQMVRYSWDSISDIAHSVGYASSSTLTLHYRKFYGITPVQDRKQTFLPDTGIPVRNRPAADRSAAKAVTFASG
ncbi:helix-turn-helix domain-containing protein [Leisingera sp. SS27]|uniref:GlxA family transcriptional regulator n=1 Tax=Leisingera sp. SS27 TaxID=2979462 RepID=UPI002331380A|nr:helix-turn-helix domain-containing protein [Leisingera sp. SS27]MDC0659994.1 helix-turn-helix domain-containing protein [Leisingera sp. SS27]